MELSEITLCQWQGRQIEKAAKIMSHFVESTEPDRLQWRPATEETSKTRSVLEQVQECTYANVRFRSYLRGEVPPAAPEEASVTDLREVTEALKSSAKSLADEISRIRADELGRVIETHRGPMPLALAIQFPLRNMVYHMGQINMIQLLYGDAKFHIDEEFLTL